MLAEHDHHQPLVEHLLELRRRVIYSLCAFTLAMAACYLIATPIFEILVQPLAKLLQDQGLQRHLIYTGLTEAFITYLKVAGFAGFILSFPFIASQLWLFIAPGLYKHERKILSLVLIGTPALFVCGACFAYFFILPAAYQFFLSFESNGGNGTLPILLEPRVGEYLSFVMRLILAFGLSFQLPILLTMLASLKIITSQSLLKFWRIAIVTIFAIAAVITPPDMLSMIGLAIPLMILYGLSIGLVKIVERHRDKKDNDECLISN